MGALLAIPPDININNLGLSKQGIVIAQAVQDYGIYIIDRGGDGGKRRAPATPPLQESTLKN
jgi:hypothetical protein